MTTGKTAEELDDYFMRHSSEREALAGVQMSLQKWDSAAKEWRDYNYRYLCNVGNEELGKR